MTHGSPNEILDQAGIAVNKETLRVCGPMMMGHTASIWELMEVGQDVVALTSSGWMCCLLDSNRTRLDARQ
eukprot:5485133-Amphidinium_carterae.1